MSETTANTNQLKELIKTAIVEILQEQQEVFTDIIIEAIEDIGLVKAIEEGESTELVSGKAIFIADFCFQLQPTCNIHLLCIHAHSLTEMTDTTEIAQELCNLIFLKALIDDIPEVNNAPQLKRHFIQLKNQLQKPKLALILHNCQPHPELIKFCRQITDVMHIGFITDSPIEHPLKGFPPNQPNLVNAIESWLEERARCEE